MVDINPIVIYMVNFITFVQIPLWSILTFIGNQVDMILLRVQIPLWSILTHLPINKTSSKVRSDSSMVDINSAA